MTTVVNLRSVRKAKAREARESLAAENRLKHGQPRAAREKAQAEQRLADEHLDGHRLGDRAEP
ncbi:DUF4169 family protein [Labrys wisconsinensis]|uniref:DUF4169 domain-containing protein n=1 Tax=Labrys wisconsinensis TaxID=425677 RepID=A0ABU0JB45_9HYPH|nr:DUF4169 family protein [Labrys wisconsinensis]MDQ0471484.1 hypothetical protein [Labrys wisconsinensis]